MFLSNVAFHPGFSPSTRKLSMRKFSLRKSPSPTPSRNSISHSHSCELWLLSTLQGGAVTLEDRQRVTEDVERLTDAEKDQLIEFLQAENGAAHCALENNACKTFLCTASELNFTKLVADPRAMVDMWNTLYQSIIPSLQSMLHSLKRHQPSFDIRRTVLTAFRDKVLLKMLIDATRLPELEPMLYLVLLETYSNSDEYKTFSALAQPVMGLPKPSSSSSSEQKPRARTLTAKRVTWHDDDGRKASTFTA